MPQSKSTADLGEAIFERESLILAPYAAHSRDSRGRRYSEPNHPYRGPFGRDRDRIVHSSAYRRLSYKTQVFTGELGDYHRTRLTHTLEVASIARNLGRALRLNEDLIEALALAHDIGHPPFGHAGEDTLDACLSDEGGFNHNRQALRIVEDLELRYPEFPGLNLSYEVLEGQRSRIEKGQRISPLLEVQVVDAADSIAYDTHDADDAMHLGLVSLPELLELPLWSEAARRVHSRYSNLDGDGLRRAVLHELIDWQVGDLLARTSSLVAGLEIQSGDDIRSAGLCVVPNPDLAEMKQQLESFLFERVYRHAVVLSKRTQAQESLRAMFARFVECPELLPSRFLKLAEQFGVRRSTGDYLAGMTDRYTRGEFTRLFGANRRSDERF